MPPAPAATETKPLAVDQQKAARLLGISVRTLIRRTNDGDIPSRKLGRRRLYSVEELRRVANGTCSPLTND